MTTLVALATRDALVLGCDSLGTQLKYFIDPFDLMTQYFDRANDFKLKYDTDGAPVLKDFDDIYKKAQEIPFNQITYVSKLFDLSPLKMGIMVTGIISIKDRTINSLINEFKSKDKAFKNIATNYTVKSIANRVLDHIGSHYELAFPQAIPKPELELMIGGYDKQKHAPSIYRIFVHSKKIAPCFECTPGIAFGGQMKEIQRIVFGTDYENQLKIIARMHYLLDKYQGLLQAHIRSNGIDLQLPDRNAYKECLKLFAKDWALSGLDMNFGDYSEQNAIECVNFFVEVMIRSQQFSSLLPTVGGDVHIGLITKRDGFRYISREEYEHKGYKTTKVKGL